MKYILLIWFLIPLMSFAQQEVKHDSLFSLLEKAETDTVKAHHYLSIGDLYQYTELDTALHYYHRALQLARKGNHAKLEAKCYNHIGIIHLYRSEFDKTVDYFKKSLAIKESIGDFRGMANSYNNLGIIAKNQGDMGIALDYYDKVLKIRKKILRETKNENLRYDCLKNIGDAFLNIGNVKYQLGEYPKAISNYKKSLTYYDSVSYSKGISSCYNNIGNIFEEQKNYDKAINYYQEALEINLELNEVRNIGTCYNNIGEIYLKKSNLKNALQYFERSLKYREQTDDKRGVSAVYSNLGMVYFMKNDFENALNMINKALKIDYQIGDKKGTSEDLNYLSRIHLKKGEYQNAIEMAMKSLEISSSIQTPLQSKESHELLSFAYERLGDYKKSLEHHKQFKSLEDQLFNKEKHEQIEELEQKYQAEKKQEQLKRQDAMLQQKEAEIKQQKTLKIVYFGGSVILLIMSLLVYWHYRQNRSANKILTLQKEEIQAQNEKLQQQNEEISAQRDELEKQRDIANDQRNAIATKNEEITSSIQYAKSIQSAVLPQDYHISKTLRDYFILFKPKDIVSGDFYWINRKNDKVIAAAVDCTGHGVPGAFMSLLGMSLLNDIVDEMEEIAANEILNILRTRLIQSLHQKGLMEENRDGMDIALIVWNEHTNQVQYSGAYNPLYVIREGKLIEYKANRMSISIRSKLDQPFRNNIIQLQPGDVMYLATDGYPDQISEETHKKMTRMRFKDYLVSVSGKDLTQQKERLDQYFEEWRGNYEQVDDVLLIGIKV